VARSRIVSRAPLAVAAVVSTPLFFAALMAASLAVERPDIVRQARRKNEIFSVFDQPTTWTEVKIWLLGFSVIAVVLLAGCAGMFFRQGVFLAGLSGIVVPIVLTHRLDRWTAHHADRFPYGVDLINDSSTSNLLLKGEWEEAARVTTSELSWATIGLAGAAIVIAALLEQRRRQAPTSRSIT
jgi:hypothetical protein